MQNLDSEEAEKAGLTEIRVILSILTALKSFQQKPMGLIQTNHWRASSQSMDHHKEN